jgi:TP901 family phage tail tape measure protein
MADNFGLKIGIEGEKEFKSALSDINRSVKLLGSEMKLVASQFDKNDKSVKSLASQKGVLNKEIDAQKSKVETLRAALDNAAASFGENDKRTQAWATKLNEAEAELNDLERELKETESAMHAIPFEQAQEKAGKLAGSLDAASRKLAPLSLAASGALVGAGKAAVDFESAFAGVQKTVDATDAEFDKLRTGILDMSKEVPASANAIAGVAEAAGQLGIKKENILEFSRTMIDLGESTNLTSDEAATLFAQFANITGMDQSQFGNLGSSIVDLGNHFATTEADIANMSMRLAGAGTQIGLTQPEILGIATALSSVGIEAEAGGSAFSKVFANMQIAVETGGESLEQFAAVAGMSADEFANKFKTAPAEAIQAFVGGLAKISENGDSAIVTLDGMGITEVRMRDALLRSAGASDMFSSAISTANIAFKENTALGTEAEKRYATTASQIAIMKNEVIALAVDLGGQLLPIVKDVITHVKSVVEWFTSLDASQKKMVVTILGLTAALAPALKLMSGMALVVKGVIGVTQGISAAVKGVALAQNASTAAMVANKVAMLAQAAASKVVAAAQWLLNAAMSANPIGIIIIAIAALVAAFVILWNKSDAFREFILGVWEAIKTAFGAAVEFIKEIPGKIVEFFTAFTDFFKELPGRLWEWLVLAATKILEWGIDIRDKAVTAASGFLTDVVTFFSELPGKVWEWLLGMITKIASWAIDIRARAVSAASGFVSDIISFFSSLPGKVWSWLVSVVTKIASWAIDIRNKAAEAARNFITTVIDFFATLPTRIANALGSLGNIGKNLVIGLWNGIADVSAWLWGKISGFFGGIVDNIKNFFGIHSPSTLFAGLGENMGEGIGVGFGKAMDHVGDDMAAAIPTGFDLPGMEINAALSGAVPTGGGGSGSLLYIGAKLDLVAGLLAEMFPRFLEALDIDIVLNDGTLVGKLAPEIDARLAALSRKATIGGAY